jgi:hypothetical protein
MAWVKGLLKAAFYLQAAILSQGYNDFGLPYPVSQDLGGFQEFKGGGCFPGGEDYPTLFYPAGYALLPFQRYFVYGFLAIGGFYLHIEDRFSLKDTG